MYQPILTQCLAKTRSEHVNERFVHVLPLVRFSLSQHCCFLIKHASLITVFVGMAALETCDRTEESIENKSV